MICQNNVLVSSKVLWMSLLLVTTAMLIIKEYKLKIYSILSTAHIILWQIHTMHKLAVQFQNNKSKEMINISPMKHIVKKSVIKVLLIGAYWRWNLAKKWKKIWEDCGCIALTSLTKDTPQFRQHKFLCIHMLPAILKIRSLWVHHNYDSAQSLLYWNCETPIQLTI